MERDDAWVRAQKELEEERRRKAEAGQQKDGKSLFEVLQQNKSELLAFSPSCPSAWHCAWWRPMAKLAYSHEPRGTMAIRHIPVKDDEPR